MFHWVSKMDEKRRSKGHPKSSKIDSLGSQSQKSKTVRPLGKQCENAADVPRNVQRNVLRNVNVNVTEEVCLPLDAERVDS